MAEGAEEEEKIEEGKVYSVGDPAWKNFPPKEGCVVEFEALGEDGDEETRLVWCAMLCLELRGLPTGDFLCAGRFLGAESDAARKRFGNLINRRGQVVHFCPKNPCDLDDEQVLDGVAAHSKRGRFWPADKFPAEYLLSWGNQVLKEYVETGKIKRRTKGQEGPSEPEEPAAERSERKDEKKKKKRKEPPGEKDPEKPKGGERPRRKKRPEKEDQDLGMVSSLRAKLRGLRQRMDGGNHSSSRDVVAVESSEDGSSDHQDYTSALVESALNTGEMMNPRLSRMDFGHRSVKLEDTRGGTLRKMKDRSKKVLATGDQRRTSGQLLAIAEQREAAQQESRRKKKDRRSGSSRAKAVVRLLKGKRKKKKDEDPSDDGGSSDGSSSSEESSSESEPLAPLLRRSRKSPGKVLKLLVEHAQQALDQSALVETSESNPVTGGVKMATYFNLLIRPYHPTTSRDMKELHHLAICLDELRSGRLGMLGDSLASRFLAIHSAVNEGGWKAAQFLELHPLEPTASAPTSLLLQARKHANVVAKSQGNEGYNRWQRPGGQWQRQEDQEKGKGKGGKGKGKKGRGWKGQGSQWWQGSGNWENKDSWWGKEKERKGRKEEEAKKAEK